jgi:hypothetical protein
MMQSYLPGALAEARTPVMPTSRTPGFPICYFDLQIIQGLPQVKTLLVAAPRILRISLGFKQLARGLHAVVAMAAACGRVACGDSHHQNKLAPESSDQAGVDLAALRPVRERS